MIKNMEQMSTPMQIYKKDNWLAHMKECGQTYKLYKQGGPHISWFNNRINCIYLFKMDESISDQQTEIMRQYCEYFFLGCVVKILKPGGTYYVNKKKMKVP